jgi:hypothetical protein
LHDPKLRGAARRRHGEFASSFAHALRALLGAARRRIEPQPDRFVALASACGLDDHGADVWLGEMQAAHPRSRARLTWDRARRQVVALADAVMLKNVLALQGG